MKFVVTAERPTPILWRRDSGLESPTEVPASTLPARGMAPVRANIASRSVVLPLWNGPTSAMHRGPRGLLTSCPIAASFIWSSALDWVGGWMLPPLSRFGKPEKRRCGSSFGTYRHRRRVHELSPRHCECNEAIHSHKERVDCFVASLLAKDGESGSNYLPGRSSKLSSPAAMLRPTWPCTLRGCNAIELFDPPTSTLPPAPTPIAALPCAPA